jgi:hypothetical protein
LNNQRVLFPEFLDNPSQYHQAETFWKTQWQDVVRGRDDEDDWEVPWLRNTFANGAPCLDGNPIFSAICRPKRIAVRVIQVRSLNDEDQFSFWTDTYATGEPKEIRELVLSCVLTERTVYYCLDAISQWIDSQEVQFRAGGEYPTYTEGFVIAKGYYKFPSPGKGINIRQIDLAA